MSKIGFRLRQWASGMWFMPAIFCAVATLTVLAASLASAFAPDGIPVLIPKDAVVSILTILASSLLTVAVFALSSMVGALSSASQSTSPRAVPLIASDRTAQTSISLFIGAFLFAIVGIIALSSGFYSEAGRLVLFAATLVVVVLVVVSLIRWIGQVSAIGRVSETIDRAERATRDAFRQHDAPYPFGCRRSAAPDGGVAVYGNEIGYVQHFDAPGLQRLADKHEATVHIAARPGAFVEPGRPLAVLSRALDDDDKAAFARCFVVGDARSFEGDPRLGLIVLNEIAIRALSPAINDPGTAIDVVGTVLRVLLKRRSPEDERTTCKHHRVSITPLEPADIMIDAFRPIIRDGAGQIELVTRVLAALETLSRADSTLSGPAIDMARDAVERAGRALTASRDLEALAQASAFARADQNAP